MRNGRVPLAVPRAVRGGPGAEALPHLLGTSRGAGGRGARATVGGNMHSPLRFRRPGRVLWPLAALGLLAGCGARTEAEPVTLAALADRTLDYALMDVDTVEVLDAPGAYRFTVVFSLPESGCTRLTDGVTATFNGQPMKLEPGGPSEAGGRDACEPTRAWMDFDPLVWENEPVEDARVFLQDGTHSMTLVLRGAKAKRRFLYQGLGDASSLKRGQTHTFLWVPDEVAPESVGASLLREGGSAPASLALTQEGGRVSFHLLDTQPLGTHLLRLSGSVPGEVLACEGVARCEGALFHSEEFIVTVN